MIGGIKIETDIVKVFESLIGGRGSGIGRLFTIKVLLYSKDWIDFEEAYSRVKNDYGIGTNYLYELARKYPNIVEKSSDGKLVRIRLEARPFIEKLLDDYIAKAKSRRKE